MKIIWKKYEGQPIENGMFILNKDDGIFFIGDGDLYVVEDLDKGLYINCSKVIYYNDDLVNLIKTYENKLKDSLNKPIKRIRIKDRIKSWLANLIFVLRQKPVLT